MTGGKWWWCWLAKCQSVTTKSTTRDDDALTDHKLSLVPVSASAGLAGSPPDRLPLSSSLHLHDRDKGKSNLHLSNLTEYHISRQQYATCC